MDTSWSQVRQASAEAIASLSPKQMRYKDCLDMLGLQPALHNERHGNLLLAESFLKLGIEMNDEQRLHLAKALEAHVHEQTTPPLIMATITEILALCAVATKSQASVGRSLSIGYPSPSTRPGTSLWQSAQARLQSGVPSGGRVALHQALLPGASPDERIEALQDISVIDETQDDLLNTYGKLRSLYDVTTHVPLKEAILPALAAILVSQPPGPCTGSGKLTMTTSGSRSNLLQTIQ